MPAMSAVAPRAMARFRHSRRTTNQIRPTPGVTFVSSGTAQSTGYRKLSTATTPRKALILPKTYSRNSSGNTTRNQLRVTAQTARPMDSIHTLAATCHGTQRSGSINWENAGE